ncbi:MAG: enoyl-CoA hydratase [Rhodothermia bacterium]|nr:enoyl-CoA hydratase [Rhodothermia bacterium]
MSEIVLSRPTDNTALIQFNRPGKKNALTVEMYMNLCDALDAAEDDDSVRVHVLLGTEDCFTAGNDLTDFLDNPPQDDGSPVLRFLKTVSTLRKPLVAGVTGPAVGIGTTLLLHCDIVVAGEHAYFQMPFTRLGLCPEAGSSLLLPLSAGPRLAAELLLYGNAFDAEKAARAGLVNEIVPDAEVHEIAMSRAADIALLPPGSVQLTKKLLRSSFASRTHEVIETEGRHFIERLGSAEAKEALTAFVEKRAPDFSRF